MMMISNLIAADEWAWVISYLQLPLLKMTSNIWFF